MKATIRTITRSHRAARTTSKALAYRTLSGIVATLVDAGRLIRTGDLLDRLGADDLPDGQRSWYGRHAAKAYRTANDGAAPIQVWAQHRTTGRWVHVNVFHPLDPALYVALQSYKATRYLVQASYQEAAQTNSSSTRASQFDITVFATADGDLAWFGTASTASEMEQCVTELHQRFPAPQFRVEVKPAPLPRWDLTPSQEAALDSAYWETRWADDDETEPDDEPSTATG